MQYDMYLLEAPELGIYKRKEERSQNLFFFLGRDLVFFLFFLMKILFSFLFSLWSSCFLPFFLMICTSSEHLSWGFIKEKEKDFKTCFFLGRDLVFFLFFLVKILVSWSNSSFLSFFLESYFFWSKACFLLFFKSFKNSHHYCCFFYTI